MKVKLLPEKCIACGLCQTYSPVFDYDDDGIVLFSDSSELEKTFPDDTDILLASKSCPTKAIIAD
ncbi:ferredoxin [Streptococcus gallinaceus]|uniref:Ferredoxin n=1 Tax=Streptococcus gallinaceus TaxID=165758 RepID=A0ABV2JJ52_9STRE|nr:ferredoxin [Streptococcus gallinaceus]MCP1639104.1 ferredoxin [Streptococcus gallinaceus]MCP1769652.1 ferredoxin [Streptococcus gallinaceus]